MSERSLSDYTLFAEAWGFLAFARLTLLFAPFKTIAKYLGKPMYEAAVNKPGEDSEVQARIKRAITRASLRSPWRTKCFEQAIAGKIMLKMRGIKSTVYFGVNKAQNEMTAHAWLISNSIIVTGAQGVDKFTVVSWFGS